MNYKYLGRASNGNLRYLVSLNVYRDCFQSEINFDPVIKIGVYLNDDDKNRTKVTDFPLIFKKNVLPPGNVDCNYYAENVCIEYGYYEGEIELAPYNAGYHLTFVRCCRNLQKNIPPSSGSPNQGQTYYCYIPSHIYENSSPVFSGVPSPYMCVNDTTDFLFNAFDPDGDDLTYRLVRPFQGGDLSTVGAMPDPPATLSLPITPIYYNAGYTETKPFGTANGSVTAVNPITGLTTIYAPSSGSYVVGIEVIETRDGVELSRIRMDLQILVLDCPPNKRPNIRSSESKVLRVDAGEKLCFDVTGEDSDDDQVVKLSGEGPVLDGTNGFTGTRATFSDAAGIETITSEFCWDTDCDHARDAPYLVTFKVEDGGCPPKFNYLDVEIYVDPFVGTLDLLGPIDVCRYNSYIYRASNGSATSTYEWDVTNGTITSGIDDETIIVDWDGANPGAVRMREVSEHGCFGEWATLDVSIKESPTTPVITGKDTVCLAEVGLTYSSTLNAGNTYKWTISNATFSSTNQNNATIGTYNQPEFTLKLVEINEFGCASDTGYKEVFVSNPQPDISGPTTICPNSENVVYTTTNNSGSTYNWNVIGGIIASGNTTNSISVNFGNEGLGEVSVVETNRHGCVSNIAILPINKTYVLIANDIIGPIDVCEFDVGVEYNTLEVNGSAYLWNVNGGTQTSGDTSFVITVDWGATGMGSVSYRQRAYDQINSRECLSPLKTLDVTIHPKPTADEISGPIELCQFSDSATYTINGPVNSAYEWAINGDPTDIVGQGSNSITVYWNTAGTYTLSVQETTLAGCIGDIVDTTVLINPKPSTTPISGDSIICPEFSDNQNYTVIGSPSSTFDWFVGGARNYSGQGTNSILINWEPSVSSGIIRVVEISDKGCLGDTQVLNMELDRLKIDLRFVSVGTPDDRMIIDWQLSENAEAPEFNIQRIDAGGDWNSIATVAGYQFRYTENNINTDLNPHQYRIVSTNKCGTQISSETHTNVLIQGTQDKKFNITLNFSDYLGWDNGVSNYSLYESINNTPYNLLQTGLNPFTDIPLENKIEDYKKCYRIYAEELMGEETSSWSNEICFFFSPEIYVPNAFTPNNDNINDGFGVKGIAINEFTIKIYNRWGEQLYESNNIDEKWLPIYRGKDVPMGTYVYLINYTDFENKIYSKTGTINLIR
ncbi:MAG: gliding motility-associated C-terminal domain-containing protein [Bacteroidia bacterium]|nr:gliding motility-associated C-terminal domain-containing protein [Bacteroidia bacterium]